jgi:hypothetical protein
MRLRRWSSFMSKHRPATPVPPMPLFAPRQIPPLSELPEHLTLNEIYGWQPVPAEDRWSGLTTRLAELGERPLARIDEDDVCFLLRHHTGVEVFLDQALCWLEQDPLVDMLYPGDLLFAVLGLDLPHLMASQRLQRLITIVEDALTDPRLDSLPRPEVQRAGIEAGLDRLHAALAGGATD